MTKSRQRANKIQKRVAEVTEIAQAQGYRVIKLVETPDDFGTWHRILADDMVIGAGDTWTVCLDEAEEYLS